MFEIYSQFFDEDDKEHPDTNLWKPLEYVWVISTQEYT